MLYSLLLVLNVVSAIVLVLMILLQRSETSIGGAFGGAATGTQVRNPLAKPTAWVAFVFMASCLGTTLVGKGTGRDASIVEQFTVETESEAETEAPALDAEIEAPTTAE